MEIVAELLLFLAQLLVEVFGEVVLEVGLSGLKAARGRRNRDPLLAAVGYLTLGGAVGGASLWLWPGRVLGRPVLPGASLVLGPLAGGTAMDAWGRFRRHRGHETTNLATFLGGAAFALGCAIVRFAWVR